MTDRPGAVAKAVRARMFTPADIAEWRKGWRVVAGAAVGMGTGIALYLLIGSLFIPHITREFGWTRGDLAAAGMLAFVVGALILPVIGRVLDIFGFRKVVIVCVPALGALYFFVAFSQGSYELYLAIMVWGGIFGGGTAAIAYTRPVIASFTHQRGLALGLATAGTSITAMIVPPLLTVVMATYGWRWGLFGLAFLTVFVGLPIALMLIGHAREARVRATDEVPDIEELERHHVPDRTLGQALRGARFWLLALALMAINIPGSGVVGQLAPLIGDRGFAAGDVAIVMSIYAAGLLVGRLLTGFALDRFSPSLVAAVMTFIPAIGISLLLIPSPSFALAALAVGMIGMQQGSEVDVLAYFVSRGFGLKNFSSIFGLINTAGAVSTALAIVLFGEMHDRTGSYDIPLMIGAVAFCIGAASFAAAGRSR